MDLTAYDPWWRFGVALLVGALIGLEREFVQQRAAVREFGGIRTFTLLALLGAVGAHLSRQYGPIAFAVAYAGAIVLLAISSIAPALKGREEGITTEVAALLVPALAALIMIDRAELGAALGVLTALALALRAGLHGIARRMEESDLRATLEFAIITAVILPLLPNRGFGPGGVLNPFGVWLMVVLVSGLSFLGYVLIKVVGTEKGIGLTGLLGGLVSSTATTISLANRSKGNTKLSNVLVLGILLSSSVMFPRMLVEVSIVNAALLPQVALPLVAMLTTGLVLVAYFWRIARDAEPAGLSLGNPLRLRAAISFGLLFAAVLVIVQFANDLFGATGVLAASAIAAVTDVDSITLSAANLARSGALPQNLAAWSIVLAAIVNTLVKAGMAATLGSPELRRRLLLPFTLVAVAGAASALLSLA